MPPLSIDLDSLDLEALKRDVARALADGIADLVEGAKQDVETYADQITSDMLEATLTGNEQVTAQLLDQLQVVAEINRVRVENHTWNVVAGATRAIFRAALAGALSVTVG